ncbi:MAG: hypothetical protein KDH88_04120 [Chromatiales bacterium]|nr:hypothetical protein [Chromatiales bacterium]
MQMHVAGMQAGQMRGSLHWPDIKDVYTEMVGTAAGCKVLFTETRVIRGPSRSVVLNGRYQGVYDPTGDTITGKWLEPRGLREGGQFQIKRVSL